MQKKLIYYSILTSSVICCLVGAFLLTGSLDPQSQDHLLSGGGQRIARAGQSGLALAHHLPFTPTQKPLQLLPQPPVPISPFPTTLNEQVAVLQAKDRLFFSGNAKLPEVALTFDDGPNPPYTNQVLALLKHYGIPATFFCVGKQVAAYPDLVKQEAAAGYTIANHTWTHPMLTSLSTSDIRDELSMTSDIIQKTTGVRPIYFRPPYGAYNARVFTQLNQFGFTTFLWSDGSLDWTALRPAAISRQVLSHAANGAIILMHDGGGDRSRTIAALPSIIEGLQARHFRFVTLEQLVADAHMTPSV
ncbi:MAG: polysaccharide deacetylase family protein [Ktedonobacteraceae bacterium]|nr:polysaccharide deacetylase family protein [Ktedonobacteraceae bacterium]